MAHFPEYHEASNFTKNLACAGLTDTEKAIIKATYQDDSPPKPKHITTLLKLADFDTSFFGPLFRRLATREYRVVLKTLMVFHQICRDGPITAIRSLESKMQFFQQLTTYRAQPSPVHSRLIRLYSTYWVAKLQTYSESNRSPERDSPNDAKLWAMKLNTAEAVALLAPLQKQIDALLNVDPAVPFIDPNIRFCFNLLIRDAMRLYNLNNLLLSAQLVKMDEFTRQEAAVMLQCCANAPTIDSRFARWHDILKKIRIATDSLPAMTSVSANILSLLQARVAEFDAKAGAPEGESLKLYAAGAVISSSPKTPGTTTATTTPATARSGLRSAGGSEIKLNDPHTTAGVYSTPNLPSSKVPSSANAMAKQSSPHIPPGSATSAGSADFTFDAFSGSEWDFGDEQRQGGGGVANDPFATPQVGGGRQGGSQSGNFGNNNNNNNNFVTSGSASSGGVQQYNTGGSQTPQGPSGQLQVNHHYPSSAYGNFYVTSPNPSATNLNNHTTYSQVTTKPPQQENDPFAAFDAFADAVPQASTAQIRTSHTGSGAGAGAGGNNSGSSGGGARTQTESQINNLYAQPHNSPNFPNAQQNQAQQRGSVTSASSPHDDPFGALVNNNPHNYNYNYNQQQNPAYQQPSIYNNMMAYNNQPNQGGGFNNNNNQNYNQNYNQNNNQFNNNQNQQQFNNNNTGGFNYNNPQGNYNNNQQHQQQQQQRQQQQQFQQNNNNNNNNNFLPF